MGYTDGERHRARGAAVLEARRAGGGRFAAGDPLAHGSLLRHAARAHHSGPGAPACLVAPAVTAETGHAVERRSFMRVTCATCGRSAVSDTLTPAELCQLISWEYRDGDVACVQCQWVRGERPRFVDRYGPAGQAETRSWFERLANVGDWWRGSVGRDT